MEDTWYTTIFASTAQAAKAEFIATTATNFQCVINSVLVPAFVGDGTDYIE